MYAKNNLTYDISRNGRYIWTQAQPSNVFFLLAPHQGVKNCLRISLTKKRLAGLQIRTPHNHEGLMIVLHVIGFTDLPIFKGCMPYARSGFLNFSLTRWSTLVKINCAITNRVVTHITIKVKKKNYHFWGK